MKTKALTLLLFFMEVSLAYSHDYHTLSSDVAREWMYRAVHKTFAASGIEEVVKKGEAGKIGSVTEEEIDDSIEGDLVMWKTLLEMGDIDEDEYESEVSALEDRESVRKELLEVEGEIAIEDGLAACELVVALLNKETMAFSSFMLMQERVFYQSYIRYKGSVSQSHIKSLLPLCKKFVEKTAQADVATKLGLYGEKERQSLADSIDELKRNIAD